MDSARRKDALRSEASVVAKAFLTFALVLVARSLHFMHAVLNSVLDTEISAKA